MFIYTLRGSTVKFICILLLCAIALVAVVALIPTYHPTALSADTNISFENVKTGEERIRFLSQFGWQVDPTPIQETTVTIPAEFDKVFLAYNNIQQQQGLDLGSYQKKTVERYTYTVTNYPDYAGKVYANILVYRGRVIGGDVCAADVSGFIHGFTRDAVLPSD